MKFDNPAGRLFEVLNKVKKYPPSSQARLVWRETFELPAADQLSPLMTAKIATTMLLIQQSLELLNEEHPELADHPPAWASQVSSAFQAHNMHGDIAGFVGSITAETLSSVLMTAALLDKGSNRKALSAEQLVEMREAIATVLDEVLDSTDLETDLKIYVARSLRKILAAIDEYKLTGATPILESIEQAVGHAMVDPKYRNFLTDTQLGQRVFDAFQTASAIVTVATGMPQLTSAVQMLLAA